MKTLTFHKAGQEVIVLLESIHYVEKRSFGDVTFGSMLIVEGNFIEIDESSNVAIEMIRLANSVVTHEPENLVSLEQYQPEKE